MKITKKTIEHMKDDIYAFCKMHKISKWDFSVLYNGKMSCNISKNWRRGKLGVKENVDPHDYCEYYSEQFILGINFDGEMYDIINGYSSIALYEEFRVIFEKYNCYLEQCDSCHAQVVYDGDYKDVEYTEFKKEKIIKVYNSKMAPDTVFATIIQLWYELSARNGDEGSCVIGAKLEMKYKGDKYRVNAQSPYQGSVSWERPLEVIKKCFEYIGCEDIVYLPGRMD